MTTKGISVAAKKQKGRNLQKWVRDKILALLPSLEPDDVKSTSMGAGGEDVQLSPAARKKIPISVECKSRKSVAIYKDYQQAIDNAPKGMEPVVVIKADRKKPLVVVDAEFFLRKMVT